jgi:hypothetical protein
MKRRPECYGGKMAVGDLVRLLKGLGHDFGELSREAQILTLRRTQALRKQMHVLEQRMHQIRMEDEYRVIWSKLFDKTGELKSFATVENLARRERVSATSIRRWIARGKLRAIRGYKGTFVDIRNLPADRQGAAQS